MSIKEFDRRMETLSEYITEREEDGKSSVYNIPYDGSFIWVRLKVLRDANIVTGLAEDITTEKLEMKKIEYERDYDLLTNLYNRRGFIQSMESLFCYNHDEIKVAAMMMIDIDNLKYVNDNYGHDYGDIYIKTIANCIKDNLPVDNCFMSRFSGDEFYCFIYGMETKEQINNFVKKLWYNISENCIMVLPNGDNFKCRASGGVAWYPDDDEDYKILMKYADFAMYKIKNTVKGYYSEFSKSVYLKESYLLDKKEVFDQFIEEELVDYHLQPIVCAKTGEIFGYEALMRPRVKSLKSPLEILTLAKKETRLHQIESLTITNAFKTYKKFLSEGKINENSKIFINSIANQILNNMEIKKFEDLNESLLKNLVIEFTEEEMPDAEITKRKKEYLNRWNAQSAIDDYGAGYNSEVALLGLMPDYIKLDMEIVRDIDSDIDKQHIAENIIHFAKNRDIGIIAEGVETLEEMKILIRLGADYLQGYYIAVPAKEPKPIAKDRINEIIKNSL